MKKVEIGSVFKRGGKLYEVIGTIDNKRVILSKEIGRDECPYCGNRFITEDVESSPAFQESIESVKTVKY